MDSRTLANIGGIAIGLTIGLFLGKVVFKWWTNLSWWWVFSPIIAGAIVFLAVLVALVIGIYLQSKK